MDSRLTLESLEAHVADLRRRADSRRAATPTGRSSGVTVRRALPEDARDIDRLAQLDSAPLPTGSMLVAEVGGEIVAAVPRDGSRPVANPFKRTAGVVRLLELRAARLNADEKGRARARRLAPRAVER